MAVRYISGGESHGSRLICILEGLPAGVKVSSEFVNAELKRRQSGYGRGGRMKIESDRVEFLSGIRFGETIGSPITLSVENRDWQNWTERMSAEGSPFGEKVTNARPGHADLTGAAKFARSDVRDILERSSARETTMRVAAGALCKIFLQSCGVEISSAVLSVGGVSGEQEIKNRIDAAKSLGDTVGGVFEVKVSGVPAGLGSHIQWDRKLDAKIAAAFMSIQAIKAVELGDGFSNATKLGSEVHDEIFIDGGKIFRKTNRAGGFEGGMTNGETLIIRAAMKPIPTLMKPLQTVDIATKLATTASKERSDTCAIWAAAVVGEAMAAIVTADAFTEKFGGDALCDTLANLKFYRERLKKDFGL
ncbi:MAG: chorismate synthase [Quinella sp. 3Q1]|nr:chorismate synthase [Quinella sp. 3Q1]MBR3050312.1 chorismate synthase [Selenomonadaceae bacterium]